LAKKRLPMRKIRDVLRLKFDSELTHREIAAACGISAGTVSDYVRRAGKCGLGWPLPSELDDATLGGSCTRARRAGRDRGRFPISRRSTRSSSARA